MKDTDKKVNTDKKVWSKPQIKQLRVAETKTCYDPNNPYNPYQGCPVS